MKKVLLLTILGVLFIMDGITVSADCLRYTGASEFPVPGKSFSGTVDSYDRLPAYLEGKTRPEVWLPSVNTSGLAIRIRSNSKVIAFRWEAIKNTAMNHFAPSGIKGPDLYSPDRGKWYYVNTGLPIGKTSEKVFFSNMEGLEKEYMQPLCIRGKNDQLIFKGKNLVLDFSTSAAGSIKIEMLDKDVQPLP